MSTFQPRNPDYASTVALAFRLGATASHSGAELAAVSPGRVAVTVPLGDDDGPALADSYLRGIVASVLDDACAMAALSLASPGDGVRTVEYKVNFITPISVGVVEAWAEVLRPGRNITVCRADASRDGTLVARMLATISIDRDA